MSAEAVKRFRDSMVLDYDAWRDGTGYDLAALRQMSPGELAETKTLLKGRDSSWRELDALAVIDELTGGREIEAELESPDLGPRIKAANLLFENGKLAQADYETRLCRAVRELTSHEPVCTRVLLYCQGLPTENVKQALLWASWNRTDAAFHCAALLIYLCGKSQSPISFEHRPLLFDLQPNNSHFTRQAAFDRLCVLVGMELDTDQPY